MMTAVEQQARVKLAWETWLKTLTPKQRKAITAEDTTKSTDIWLRGKRQTYDDNTLYDDASK